LCLILNHFQAVRNFNKNNHHMSVLDMKDQ
jgi:hypothetical protein